MWNERRNITTDATYIIKAKKKKAIEDMMKNVCHQISQLTGNVKFIENFYQN